MKTLRSSRSSRKGAACSRALSVRMSCHSVEESRQRLALFRGQLLDLPQKVVVCPSRFAGHVKESLHRQAQLGTDQGEVRYRDTLFIPLHGAQEALRDAAAIGQVVGCPPFGLPQLFDPLADIRAVASCAFLLL